MDTAVPSEYFDPQTKISDAGYEYVRQPSDVLKPHSESPLVKRGFQISR